MLNYLKVIEADSTTFISTKMSHIYTKHHKDNKSDVAHIHESWSYVNWGHQTVIRPDLLSLHKCTRDCMLFVIVFLLSPFLCKRKLLFACAWLAEIPLYYCIHSVYSVLLLCILSMIPLDAQTTIHAF